MNDKQNNSSRRRFDENYRGNGAQTPEVKKITPMPSIKPAKPEKK